VGNFAVAVPDEPASYHVAELGYLYFELPADPEDALREWRELARLAADDFRQPNRLGAMIRARAFFGGRGMTARVRTANEEPASPDTYRAGSGVALVPSDTTAPAAVSLWQAPKPMSRVNYARVDRVVLEPTAAAPERMQVWGAFAMGGELSSYAPPERGYLYLTLPVDRPGTHAAWTQAADAGQILKFLIVEYHKLDAPARALILFAPAGIEKMFAEMSQDPERYVQIGAKYGVTFPE
jgi:hypothetical protein